VRPEQESINRIRLVGCEKGRALGGAAAIGETAVFQLWPPRRGLRSWCAVAHASDLDIRGSHVLDGAVLIVVVEIATERRTA
jgi:hypothetical protein